MSGPELVSLIGFQDILTVGNKERDSVKNALLTVGSELNLTGGSGLVFLQLVLSSFEGETVS